MENAQNEQNGRGDLTSGEVAAALGVHPSTVRRWARRTGGQKVFGRWRFAAAVVAVVASCPSGADR